MLDVFEKDYIKNVKHLDESLDAPDIHTLTSEIKLKKVNCCHICTFAQHSSEAVECKNPQVMKLANSKKFLDTFSWMVCKFYRN